MVAKETIEEVGRFVRGLPQRERVIVSLHFVEGLTMRQIAQVLDISESRVSQLQKRALDRIRGSFRLAAA